MTAPLAEVCVSTVLPMLVQQNNGPVKMSLESIMLSGSCTSNESLGSERCDKTSKLLSGQHVCTVVTAA